MGYETYTAASGREGIKAFYRTRPDVTVLDLHLPDISGFNVLEELRPKRPMIIMLTGDGEIERAVEAMHRGAENFLTKPISIAHLQVAVDKAAEKAALNAENRTLRARMTPSPKRKIARATVVIVLVGLSAVVGSLIGGIREDRRNVPIPVPINPQDTVLDVDEAPFRAFPDPSLDRRRRD